MEFRKPVRKMFSGRVLDGPFEGEFIEHDSPYFAGHYTRPISALYTGLSAGFEIDHAVYKWLPSYRAWAWWQKS